MFNDFIVSTRIATLQIQSICLRSGVVMELTAGMTPETHEKVRLQYLHKRLRLCASACVFAHRLKRFITRNFSSQLNQILKTKPVQNRNRFLGFDILK